MNCVENLKKNRISFKFLPQSVHILETIRFILFRDDSFMRGRSNMQRYIYERSAPNIRDWRILSYLLRDTALLTCINDARQRRRALRGGVVLQTESNSENKTWSID